MGFSGIRARGWMLLALLPGVALATNNEAGVSYSHSTLDNEYEDWKEVRAHWTRKPVDKDYSYDLAVLQSQRFGLDDTQITAGGSYALNDDWALSGELAYAPDADILPRESGQLGISRLLGKEWMVAVAGSGAHYSTDTTYGGELSVEWMPKPFRVVYAALYGKLKGSEDARSHLGQVEYVYGDGNGSIGIGYADGEQPERVRFGRVELADSDSLFLNGRHWLSERWGLDYRIARYKRELFYTREEYSLGLLMRF